MLVSMGNRPSALYAFIGIIVFVVGVAVLNVSTVYFHVFQPPCPYVWHGGSPIHEGSCWCGKNDSHCMCTPNLAADAILEYQEDLNDPHCRKCQVILIQRVNSQTDKYAIPGGYVQLGESAETAVIREMKEETNMTIEVSQLEQFKLYSSPPTRDKRRQSATLVFRAVTTSLKHLHSGDDAKAVRQVLLKDVLKLNLAFDHHQVLTEYIQRYHP
ncbi:NUDIX hydrolase, partial [archaeon]